MTFFFVGVWQKRLWEDMARAENSTYAPKTYTPNSKIEVNRISPRTGRLEESMAIYDDVGRQQFRVDFTNHMRSDHGDIHLHEYLYKNKRDLNFYDDPVYHFFK